MRSPNPLAQSLNFKFQGVLMKLRLILAWAAIGAAMLSVTVARAEPTGYVTGVSASGRE